jgi:hypothetical protein
VKAIVTGRARAHRVCVKRLDGRAGLEATGWAVLLVRTPATKMKMPIPFLSQVDESARAKVAADLFASHFFLFVSVNRGFLEGNTKCTKKDNGN